MKRFHDEYEQFDDEARPGKKKIKHRQRAQQQQKQENKFIIRRDNDEDNYRKAS